MLILCEKVIVKYTAFVGHFDQVEVDKFVEESLKMSRFSHAHVMGLIGVCLDSSSALLIVMPFMDNGSLLKYLKKERENLIVSEENDEQEVYTLFGILLNMKVPVCVFCTGTRCLQASDGDVLSDSQWNGVPGS